MEWQPIETAPQQGELLLLAVPYFKSFEVQGCVPWAGTGVVLGWWDGDHWAGCFGEYMDSGCDTCGGWFEYPSIRPTHWMPLPEAPK